MKNQSELTKFYRQLSGHLLNLNKRQLDSIGQQADIIASQASTINLLLKERFQPENKLTVAYKKNTA